MIDTSAPPTKQRHPLWLSLYPLWLRCHRLPLPPTLHPRQRSTHRSSTIRLLELLGLGHVAPLAGTPYRRDFDDGFVADIPNMAL